MNTISSVNSETWKFIKTESAKVLTTAASIPFLGQGYVFKLGSFFMKEFSFCPSAHLPSGTTEFFAKNLNYPLLLCGDKCDDLWLKFKGPLFEELVDRVLLQEILLKQAPEAFLKKYSPNHVHIVDHISVRIARVLASSIFFALHHSWSHTCRSGDMYPFILAGVIFGGLQEVSGHPIYSLISHVATNCLIRHS